MHEKIWVTGRYVAFKGDMYQTGKGLEPVSEENGYTPYIREDIAQSLAEALEKANLYFKGITPDRNTQTPGQVYETIALIAEDVSQALEVYEKVKNNGA